MRFAITGCDRYAGVFEAFLAAGWTPVKLFSGPASNPFSANNKMMAMAKRHGCPAQLTRISDDDLADLAQRSCDALIVASYDWRIGNWPAHLRYAVNFHPSPLPIGRGPYPLPRAILEGRDKWGMTCHKITPEFDSGDMLAIEEFAMHGEESHETLNLKLQMAAGRLASRLAQNFTALWEQASPQGGGEYWPLFTEAERTLDYNAPVATISRVLRAFGNLECFATLNGEKIYVRQALVWPDAHGFRPGSVVHVNGQHVVVAARDGMVALLDWGLIPSASIQNPPAN
ncbi:MAG TPA: formyltransferase family protein [Burkholderiaceae bacterium]